MKRKIIESGARELYQQAAQHKNSKCANFRRGDVCQKRTTTTIWQFLASILALSVSDGSER